MAMEQWSRAHGITADQEVQSWSPGWRIKNCSRLRGGKKNAPPTPPYRGGIVSPSQLLLLTPVRSIILPTYSPSPHPPLGHSPRPPLCPPPPAPPPPPMNHCHPIYHTWGGGRLPGDKFGGGNFATSRNHEASNTLSFLAGLRTIPVISWWALDGHCNFLVGCRWSLSFPGGLWMVPNISCGLWMVTQHEGGTRSSIVEISISRFFFS